jgi:hypothetical protein
MNLNRFFRKLMIWGGIAVLLLGIVISAASFLFSAKTGVIFSSVFVVFSLIIYLAVYLPAFRKERILNTGVTAPAKITGIKETLWGEGQGSTFNRVYRIEMEITPPGGLSYRTYINDIRINMFTNAINRKLTVWVKVDPKNREKVIVEKIGEMNAGSKDVWDDAMNNLNL